jgi:ectoine hydroxylase-related dioxygenase (phytanoyl-CoA dioxygenase family)
MKIRYLNEDGEKISKSCDLEFGKEYPGLFYRPDLNGECAALRNEGFQIFSLKAKETFAALEQIISEQIKQRLSLFQEVPADFQLKNYHKYLINPETHFKVSTWALDYKIFGQSFFEVKAQMEEILGLKLTIKKISHLGVEGEYVGFRVLRPQKNDHNPFHRDSWIPYWRDTINVWLPICGFEDANSLQLIPQSHLWSDDQILKTKSGVEIEGKKYHVPAAIGTVNEFQIETPVLKAGDGILFSPYLLHGNGANKLQDITRVSLEFRFCKSD